MTLKSYTNKLRELAEVDRERRTGAFYHPWLAVRDPLGGAMRHMDHSENTGRLELPEHRWGVLRRPHEILVGMQAMQLMGIV